MFDMLNREVCEQVEKEEQETKEIIDRLRKQISEPNGNQYCNFSSHDIEILLREIDFLKNHNDGLIQQIFNKR